MHFAGNTAWFGALLTVHVVGAVVGLGPNFAFSIIGPAIGKQPTPAASLALMKIMERIEAGMVVPILLTIQPLTGVLLIFNRGLNHGFFSIHRAWLDTGILIYVAAMTISLGANMPAMRAMIRMAEGGRMTDEFPRLVKRTKILGPVLTVMAVAIIVLMAWKPGSGCGALFRC